ncbi:MAG: DNA polymerase I [Magnetococcales bacterium]|nr:DNA polymerase I [Magnetococcales bacterium]
MTSRLLLIDGSGYLYRAFYGIQSLNRRDGFPVNAIFGFGKMIRRVLANQEADHVAILFDAKGPNFRHDMDASYKANRKSMPDELRVQVPMIHRLVKAFNIPLFEMSGFEADDLIGTLAGRAVVAGMTVTIVSGDKDMLQLVSDRIAVYDPVKEQRLHEAEVEAFWGVPPQQVIEVMGLTGDQSDNIPGVPGIGIKTAAPLIRQFGTLEQLLAHLDQITQPKRRDLLLQHGDQARRSRQLATIRRDAPIDCSLDQLLRQPVDQQALRLFYQEMEFTSLLQELEQQQQQQHEPVVTITRCDNDYQTITDTEQFERFMEQLRQQPRFAIDSETTALDPMRAELVGLSFSWRPHQAFYLPVGHQPDAVPDGQLNRDQVLAALQPLLADDSIGKVGQNLKYDAVVLAGYGIHLAGVERDVMLLSHLLYGSARSHGLDQIAHDLLGRTTTSYQQVTRVGRQQVSFDQVPIERAGPYACEDAEVAWEAAEQLWPKLQAIPELMTLYQQIEQPLMAVLIDMQRQGALLDQAVLVQMSHDFTQRRAVLVAEIEQMAGQSFNLNSPQQLGTILFDKMGLPGGKRSKTGYSTDVTVLTKLAEAGHVLPARVLDYRTLTKLQLTYTDALAGLIHPVTGRVHTSFNQAATLTGRLSSSAPNLQNIPVRSVEGRAIRTAFVAPPGWLLLSADYNQIELRLLAHLGGIERLQQAFASGLDVHCATAMELFGVPVDQVSSDHRRMAKTINFGLIYGMSVFGLAQRLKIDRASARDYMERYFARYQGVQSYWSSLLEQARRQGYVPTLVGRRCWITDIASSNRTLREMAERTAINAPLQGSAADIIKLAMIQLHRQIQQQGLRCRMVLQVHDELLLELPAEELEVVVALVRRTMEQALELSLPLRVDIGHGRHWAEAH